MASELTHFRAFLFVSIGGGLLDHHAIFIQTEDEKAAPQGSLFHVTGSLQKGMSFDAKHKNTPTESFSLLSMKQIGWVSHDKFDQVEGILRTVLPPAKQYNGAKRLVPKDQIRHCQHWVAEANDALRVAEVLTLLAPAERGIIYVRDVNGEVEALV